MTSKIFRSCLRISSTVNDTPISNSMYLEVFFGATLCFSLFFRINFFPWFYTDIQHFFKLPNVNNNCKQHTDVKFDVSESFPALRYVFPCFFQSISFVHFTMMSNLFSSCLRISSIINNAPISILMYLKVFPATL